MNKLVNYYRELRDAQLERAEVAQLMLRTIRWADLTDYKLDYRSIGVQPLQVHQGLPLHQAIVLDYDLAHPLPYVAVASDGSQIYPDERQWYPIAAVNVSAVIVYHDMSDRHPRIGIHQAGPDDEAIVEILSSDRRHDGMVGAINQLRERTELNVLAAAVASLDDDSTTPIVALRDGPLAAWHTGQAGYIGKVYRTMAKLGAFVVGIVDRGEAHYVSRTLAAITNDASLEQVRDVDLFGYLQPGERSALFGLHSVANSTMQVDAGIGVGCFYLNVGKTVIRVETTVDCDFQQVQLLASLLMQECAGLNYSFTLREAHKYAVISRNAARQLRQQHDANLLAVGLENQMSFKEQAKEL